MTKLHSIAIATVLGISAYPSISEAGSHCWCEARASCSGVTLKDYGGIQYYTTFESGKQQKCANACSLTASSDANNLRSSGANYCDQLGPGVFAIAAYSQVGADDTYNNACDVDYFYGHLTCNYTCECPAGMQLQGTTCHLNYNGYDLTMKAECGYDAVWSP